MKNQAAVELGKIGGQARTEAKTIAARKNARKRYLTTVTYRAYGENNETIREAAVIIKRKLPKDEQAMINMQMVAISEDVGDDIFEECVAGVHILDTTTTER